MKEEDGTVRGGGEDAKELAAAEADCPGIVVLVGGRIDPDVPEDGEVVYCEGRSGIFNTPKGKF